MIKYLTLEQALRLHEAAIEQFGGLKGVRDSNLCLLIKRKANHAEKTSK